MNTNNKAATGGIDHKLDTLISRLNKPIKTQNGTMAFCPAHDDRKSRSLGVKIGHNGGIILKCFAGCPVDTILSAINLSMTDLFPDKFQNLYGQRQKPPKFSRYEVFDSLAYNAFIIYTFMQMIKAGRQLTDAQWA